jgi:chromosome segregation ATPase
MIQQKEEEAKFWQAQQEMLEGRIEELERQLGESQEREEVLRRDLETARMHSQQLQSESSEYREKLIGSEKERAYEQH